MATINDLIESARYDLRDYQTGLEFGVDELVLFVNRQIRTLESILAAQNSDLVHGVASLTLASGANSLDISSVLNSGNWDSIRSLWNGATQIYHIPLDDVYYKRQIQSLTGTPNFYALSSVSFIFDATADANYTLTCYYNSKSAALTIASTTPYNGIFDDMLREMLVMHAKAKKEGLIGKSEMQYSELARKRIMEIDLRRRFVKKPYYIDF